MWMSAPRLRRFSSVRSYVGDSTTTASPGLHQQLEQERVGLHRAVGDEHLLDGSTPCFSAIHLRSGT